MRLLHHYKIVHIPARLIPSFRWSPITRVTGEWNGLSIRWLKYHWIFEFNQTKAN